MQASSWAVPGGLAALALALGGCVIGGGELRVVGEEEHVFAVSGVPDVDLSTFDGHIEVRGWGRSEVRVVVEKWGTDPQNAVNIVVETEQTGDRVRVAARRRFADDMRAIFSMGGRDWRWTRLVASVPHESDVVVRTDDGRVTLADLAGTVDVRTDDGRIQGEGLRGAVRVRTDDGSVRLERVEGDVAARTGDGSINVSGELTGLEASTDDGRIVVHAAPGSVVQGDWDLRSRDGRVSLDLPRDFSAALELSTGDGRIRVDDHFGGDAERDAEALRRTIGAGGFVLRVRTGDGSIRIGTS